MKKMLVTAAAIGMLMSSCIPAMAADTVTLDFDANATTGYVWSAFIIGGDSVELDDFDGSYVEDDNPEMLDGVGGTTSFTLKACQPGRSVILFEYSRPWEHDVSETEVFLADVDEDGNLTATDITETGIIRGTVTEVLNEEASFMLLNEMQGDIKAVLADEMELPVVDEEVCLYTDGVMTMSLPPIVNVLAWASEPSEVAREGDFYWAANVEVDVIEEDVSDVLKDILSDESFLKFMGANPDVTSAVERYASYLKEDPISIKPINWTMERFLEELGEEGETLSDLALYELWKRAKSPSFLANRAASESGIVEMAAIAISGYAETVYYNVDPGFYLVEYQDGIGMILDVEQMGIGISNISACMIPDVTALSEYVE